MKKRRLASAASGEKTQKNRRKSEVETDALPSVEECRRMEQAIRRGLERVEDDVRTAQGRAAVEVGRLGGNENLFLTASATVVVSIAAGLLEVVSERTGRSTVEQSFIDAARDAAEFVQARAARTAKGPQN